MGKEKDYLDIGVAFVVFCIAVIIHNTFAPREFRQELNEYSIKCYSILILLGLISAYIKTEIDAKRRKKAIEAEEKRKRLIRAQMELYKNKKERED